MKKIFGIILIFLSFMTSGCVCNNNYNGKYSLEDNYYNDLEKRCEKLEYENQELRDRLDEINTMANDRYYNYGDILDDIEYESYY